MDKEQLKKVLNKLVDWCEEAHGTGVSEILIRLNDDDEKWVDMYSKFSIEMFKEWIEEQ